MNNPKMKSEILIFGATGELGKYMVKASISMGHPTYIYTRPIPNNKLCVGVDDGSEYDSKLKILEEFRAMGVTIVQGEFDDHEKMVSTLRQVKIVISTQSITSFLEQLKIISAIKEAGNIERFIPSEFGNEVDRITALPPFQEILDNKKKIRRATEAAGIPHTFVSANSRASYFVYYFLFRPECSNQVTVYGSGQTKAVLNYEEDIATYTIKAAVDPRTINKVIICRPPQNIVSQLDIITSWEKKTGQRLTKVYMPEEQVIQLIETLSNPANVPLAVLHDIFIKGDQTNFKLRDDDLETSVLYPDYKYTSIDAFLDMCLVNPPKVKLASFV